MILNDQDELLFFPSSNLVVVIGSNVRLNNLVGKLLGVVKKIGQQMLKPVCNVTLVYVMMSVHVFRKEGKVAHFIVKNLFEMKRILQEQLN